MLFYQDFNEQFEGYTQLRRCVTWRRCSYFIKISMNNLKDIHNLMAEVISSLAVVLSRFQWTIWRIYTTCILYYQATSMLFYQDFNEQFEGYTQRSEIMVWLPSGCFIRMSMNNLKDIHNAQHGVHWEERVVLSGFQWTIWRIYTTPRTWSSHRSCCFIRISMNNLKDIHNSEGWSVLVLPVVLSGFQWTILLQKY